MSKQNVSFEQLGLSNELLRAIYEQEYIKPTPIQERAIPIILSGKDVMGGAQTGTGKTASFTLPMLRKLEVYANSSMSPAKHPIRALILVPTRELAVQLYESVKAYGKYLPLKSTVVFGGVNIDPQIGALRAGIEILVATPGRLLDHLKQKTLSLGKVEILILDEADRMLDMGFLPDIKQIVQVLPERRQSLMFSATFSEEIKKLASKILNQPICIEVANQNSVSDLITHVVHPIENSKKQNLLVFLIKQNDLKQVLIFTRTKQGTDRLVKYLCHHGITSAALHGDRNQLQRSQALESFKNGLIQALVATDVAARGLDIEELNHVINFELPNVPEDYIHRIGRTGRAGNKGFAISLVSKEEKKLLIGVEKLLKNKINTEEIVGFEITGQQLKVTDNSNLFSKEKAKYPNLSNQAKRSRAINHSDKNKNRSNLETFIKDASYMKKFEDPLFTQPYVSKSYNAQADYTKNAKMTQREILRHKRYGQINKTLPALFIPPLMNKQKV